MKEKIKENISTTYTAYGITIDDINTALNYINNPYISKNVIINAIPDDILFHDEIVNVVNKIYDLGLQKEFIEFIKDPVNNKDALISKIPPDTPGYNEIILMVNFIADNSDLIKDYITNPDNIDFIIASIPEDTMPAAFIACPSLINSSLNFNSSIVYFNSFLAFQ